VMKKKLSFLFLNIVIVLLITNTLLFAQSSNGGESNPNHRILDAIQISESPKIDGKLDDSIWQQVTFQKDFLQREPSEGEPSSEKTEIAIIYDKKNIYIGARCFDSEPDKITATEMRRDAMLWRDDYFSVIFDTFHDHRNAVYFTTNPLGSRRDGTVGDEGKIQNSNWNGVWSCKTSIDENGWFVEMSIPWQTLRFKEGEKTTWGANFVRRIQRKNEDNYWRLVPRYGGHSGQYRMSEAGEIQGFQNLKAGGRFELKPFTTNGAQRDESTNFKTETITDFGADLKVNLTANMTADFTYNTDFAQVEADQERVNLTRFSMFFPEKREFFLEGAETFTFGQSGGGGMRRESGALQLFHSRTIGIASGEQVPILGGARLNGKTGKYTIGLLSLQADDIKIESDDEDEEPEYVPATNFSIVRIKRNLFTRSSAGVMLLNKQEKDGSFNRSFGFDSNYPVNDNLTFYAVGAGSYSSTDEGEDVDPNKDNFAGNAGFNWQSDLWQFGSSYLDIQDEFNPAMGFIRRTDIRKAKGNIKYSPRPKRFKAIRQFQYGIKGEYQTDHQNNLLNRKFAGEFDISFENSARLGFDIEQEHEYLSYDWEVRDGFLIPEATYTNTEFRMMYFSNRTRKIGGWFNANTGKYFTGTRTGGGINMDIKAHYKFTANVSVNHNLVKLPEGKFTTTTLSTRLIYSLSPDFYVKAYLQWYDDKLLFDGKSRFSGNIILRYIYRPGSDFYLVLNQENLFGSGDDVLRNRTVMFKMNYFLRK